MKIYNVNVVSGQEGVVYTGRNIFEVCLLKIMYFWKCVIVTEVKK